MDFENIEVALKKVRRSANKRALFMYGTIIAGLLIVLFTYHFTIGAPKYEAVPGSYTVSQSATDGDIAAQLYESGLIRHIWAFKALLFVRGLDGKIQPGGYAVAKTMNTWELITALTNPDQTWVVIPEGLRKEEIGAVFADKLHWSAAQLREWNAVDTKVNWLADPPATSTDYAEGVYFPDTYLVPLDETPAQAAKRLQGQFAKEFGPLQGAALAQNVKWTTAVKIGSIVQREAAGPDDMPIIAAVIWNRLEKHMALDIDATVQYARGNTGRGWWAPITAADKKIKSPYNTYTNQGLPPGPISNPGLDALKAALFPAKTKCLYYLHDSSGTIHCSETYEGQLANIKKYL